MSKNKEEYKRFLANRKDIPVFYQDWWLDGIVGSDHWSVLLHHNAQGQIDAFWPFTRFRKWGLSVSTQPPLTGHLGLKILLPQDIQKVNRQQQFQEGLMLEMIQKMRAQKLAYFNQCFAPDFQNWKPFYWQGFDQQVYYKQVLSHIKDSETIYQHFAGKVRTDIKKFQKTGKVTRSEAVEQAYELIQHSFHQQVPFSLLTFREMVKQLTQRKKGFLLIAQSTDGQLMGTALVLHDLGRAYLLALGLAPAFRNSGTGAALIWSAIQQVATQADEFDFNGSMIPSISDFFQSFGGTLEPYYRLYHYKNRWIKTVFTALGK